MDEKVLTKILEGIQYLSVHLYATPSCNLVAGQVGVVGRLDVVVAQRELEGSSMRRGEICGEPLTSMLSVLSNLSGLITRLSSDIRNHMKPSTDS